jgi:hypothetical protein
LKSFLLIGASVVAAGGLYAGGAFDGGKVYNLPIAEARSRLATLPVPPTVAVSAGGSDAAIVDVDVGSETINWTIAAGTGEPARFTASLTAEGASSTRVKLAFANGRIDGSYADRLMSSSFLRGYSETLFEEQVDSRLEGRPASDGRALQEFAERVAADPRQIEELGEVTEDIFRDVAEQVHEMSGSAEQHEPSPRETMAAATRPSLDLNQKESD